MKRRPVAVVAAVAVLAVSSSQALGAGPPSDPQASCVATITSYEASQLEPGAVGEEVSGLATSAPGIVGSLVSELALAHAGSIEACFGAEE